MFNIEIDKAVVGFVGINVIKKKVPVINATIALNEGVSQVYFIVDWSFQKIQKATCIAKISHINLRVIIGSEILIDNAKKRGFLKSTTVTDGFVTLNKICVREIIDAKSWKSFNTILEKETGYSFNLIFPTYDEITNTGILLKGAYGKQYLLDLFDFETLFSPGVLLCHSRQSMIIPIKREFAETFFPDITDQSSLFPNDIVAISNEKAYFRSPRNWKKVRKGMFVFFYVSGRNYGYMQVIGHGRITFSGITQTSNLSSKFYRQGVLSEDMISERSLDNAIHVITFDNFVLMKKRIGYDYLIGNGMISGANLVTAEIADYDATCKIIKEGYSGD